MRLLLIDDHAVFRQLGIQILFKKTGVQTRASLVRVALETQRRAPNVR